jgi:hypothetical protein
VGLNACGTLASQVRRTFKARVVGPCLTVTGIAFVVLEQNLPDLGISAAGRSVTFAFTLAFALAFAFAFAGLTGVVTAADQVPSAVVIGRARVTHLAGGVTASTATAASTSSCATRNQKAQHDNHHGRNADSLKHDVSPCMKG